MAPGLKVVALISGGKDSLFSMLHCISNGHEIVALANLSPPEYVGDSRQRAPSSSMILDAAEHEDEEDIDSFMYQTVGSSVIPLYEEALGIPLYREYITGTAIDTALAYDPRRHDGNLDTSTQAHQDNADAHADEVESMTRLLRKILSLHPSINALNTGAILSTYQRTRIESVARRVNLIPLSYLWQYPYLPPHHKSSLLQDMTAVGQDSRIIKVASSGLNEQHLWLNVADETAIATLLRDMARFGSDVGDVLGEGGEYETISVDGPRPLWKKRIEVQDEDRQIVTSSGGCHVMRILESARLAEKNSSDSDAPPIRIPELFERRFSAMLRDYSGQHRMQDLEIGVAPPHDSFDSFVTVEQLNVSLAHIFKTMNENDVVVFIMILLRNMSHFGAVNQAYDKWFQAPNPPARVTVACGDMLPEGVCVNLHATFRLKTGVKQCLHVQSRSYWAPANIGPYSQAISVDSKDSSASIIYIAGQIPLVPASMELLTSSDDIEGTLFLRQALLSLQHLWRVGEAQGVEAWPNAIAFVTGQTREQVQRRAAIACEVWAAANTLNKHGDATIDEEEDDDDESDIADVALRRTPWSMPSYDTRKSKIRNAQAIVADFPAAKHVTFGHGFSESTTTPACGVVQIQDLPRQASIEWYSTGISGSVQYYKETMHGTSIVVEFCELIMSRSRFFYATTHSAESITSLLAFVRGNDHNINEGWTEVYTAHRTLIPEELILLWRLRIIDCKSVWNSGGQEQFAILRGMHQL